LEKSYLFSLVYLETDTDETWLHELSTEPEEGEETDFDQLGKAVSKLVDEDYETDSASSSDYENSNQTANLEGTDLFDEEMEDDMEKIISQIRGVPGNHWENLNGHSDVTKLMGSFLDAISRNKHYSW